MTTPHDWLMQEFEYSLGHFPNNPSQRALMVLIDDTFCISDEGCTKRGCPDGSKAAASTLIDDADELVPRALWRSEGIT